MIGVIYNNAQNKVTVSYAYGTGSVKLYHGYCDQGDKCEDDEECKSSCDRHKRIYNNQFDILNPNLDAYSRQANIEMIKNYVYAELITNVAKILNGIDFK